MGTDLTNVSCHVSNIILSSSYPQLLNDSNVQINIALKLQNYKKSNFFFFTRKLDKKIPRLKETDVRVDYLHINKETAKQT